MQTLDCKFKPFLKFWHATPRSVHPHLPCKADFSPSRCGDLLPNLGWARYDSPGVLHVLFYGSEIERSSSLPVTGRNYFDMVPEKFHKRLKAFHHILFSTPCGAYVVDVVTTEEKSRYTYETLQLPVCDNSGKVCFLLAYGYGVKPLKDRSTRYHQDHTANNIKELRYLDLGCGAPTGIIKNFTPFQ